MARVEWLSYWRHDGSLLEEGPNYNTIMLDGIEHTRRWTYDGYVCEPIYTQPRDYTFRAELELERFEQRRAGGKFIWRNVETDATYPMRVSDAIPLLKYLMHPNVVAPQKLLWKVEKKGADYGLALASALPDVDRRLCNQCADGYDTILCNSGCHRP